MSFPDHATAQLAENGARILTDDEVVDKGEYFLVKDPATLMGRIMAKWHDLGVWYDRHFVVYPPASQQKPLLFEAKCVDRGQQYVYEHMPWKSAIHNEWRQRWRLTNLCYEEASVWRSQHYESYVDCMHLQLVDMVSLSHKKRSMYRLNLLHAKINGTLSDRDLNLVFKMRDRTREAMHRSNRYDHLIEFRRVTVSNVALPQIIAIFKEFGSLVRSGDRDEVGAGVTNLLSEMTDAWSSELANHLRVAWNNRVDKSEDQVQLCSCGHYEFVGSVNQLFAHRTACETCSEDGDIVVYLEDRNEYDLASHAYFHDDDDCWRSYAYDDSSDDNSGGSHVKNYTTDVLNYLSADDSIKSSPYGDFLMGIELEVVPTRDSSLAAEHTDEAFEGYAILKRDGSLDDGGFEIVTAPRGLAEHIKRFTDWKPYRTLRAWDPGCCGLHVHIDAKAFTAATLGKFIEFINSTQNDELIRSIAGRHPAKDDQAADYAQREGKLTTGNPKKNLEGKSVNRYHMVNTTNLMAHEALRLGLHEDHACAKHQNTIEIRVFRASLKKERLLAQVEFAHAAVMFCRWSSMRELGTEHFLKWLCGMAGVYPSLAKWFGVRQDKVTRTERGDRIPVVDATPKARAGAEV
jgi:hypothetical protein